MSVSLCGGVQVQKKSKEKPSVDFEISEVHASINPTIHLEHKQHMEKSLQHTEVTKLENTPTIYLQHNTAYGKVSLQH